MARQKVYKDFESAMSRLEEIVVLLEGGESTLEESIALYTEGVEIARICNDKLVEAEGQIARLTKMAEKFKLEKLAGDEEEND